MLQSLVEDKLLLSETLTQLPRWASKRCEVSILQNYEDERERDTVQMVVNEPGLSFQTYEVEATQKENQKLPLFLERKRETIVTSFGRGSLSADGELRFQGETRKRLGWRNCDGASKRRLLEDVEDGYM